MSSLRDDYCCAEGVCSVYCRILHRYPTILVSADDWEIDFIDLQEKINDKRREVYYSVLNIDH